MVERLIMAGDAKSPETGAVQGQQPAISAETIGNPSEIGEAVTVQPEVPIKLIPVPSELVQIENVTTINPPSPDLTIYQEQVVRQYQETIDRLAREVGILPPLPPDGGAGDGGGGGPEGPRGPLPPDYLWSSEFEARRWSVSKELFRLAGLPYEEKYNSQNGPYLKQLFRQWKALEALDNMKSFLSKPFNPRDLEQPPRVDVRERYPTQDLTGLPSVRDLFNTYNDQLRDPDTTEAQLNDTREKLSSYFKHAKNLGFLDAVDDSLRSIAMAIQEGMDAKLPPDEIMAGTERRPGIDARINTVRNIAQRLFRVAPTNLQDVWDIYIYLAENRLLYPLISRERAERIELPPSFEGEFMFDAERDEAYRTIAEGREIYWRPLYADYFEVTARTKEQFETAVESFIRWLRTGLGKAPEELFRKVNSFKETLTAAGQRAGLDEYTKGKRLELEALAAIIGANFSNEHYNADFFKQFWTFGAKDEGPDRMLALIKSVKGILAPVMWKFDKDPRLELLFSPHGARGELMGRNRNASEMGSLQNQILALLTAEVMGIALKRYHPDDSEKRIPGDDSMYERNLNEIVKFKSDEYFKNLYEGFDLQDQERLYQQLTAKQEKWRRWQQLSEDQREQFIAGLIPDNLEGTIYEGWDREEIQDLLPAEKETLARLERARRIQQYLEDGKDPNGLQGGDKLMYEEARNVATLAYELYGAMGEKAKRGGGVFLVDRRDAEGRRFRDYLPVYWTEKGGQFAENWTKATYGHLPAWELKYKVDQARRMYIWAVKTYGYDAKFWDFTLLQNGKPADPNTLGYSKYGQDPSKNENNPVERIDRYRYAPPENPRILGYNSKGEEVILVFDDEGKPVGLEYDQQGKAVIFNRPSGGNRILFDNLDKNTRAERMLLKMPGYANGKPVDFDTVIRELHSHPYSCWTGHPYWGYQEEDTGLVLSDESFDAARRIKTGELHWEDAPPHAVQLLIIDPTLERVGHFDLENLEAVVGLALVEESYQAHWRIGDELYLNFFPEDASRLKNRVEYVLQDHGGSTKQWLHFRAEAALWPDSRMRRLRTFTPFAPLRYASQSGMWGAPGGGLDVFRMMGYGKYRMVGQFAFEKWVNQIGAVQDVYESIVGFLSPQEKRSREGLGEKPTNDADALERWANEYGRGDLGTRADVPTTAEDVDNKFVNAARESLGRFEVVHQRVRVLETDMRGERAPLWLEGIEIFKRKPDGTYELDEDGYRILNDEVDWNRDSGSSRHSGDIFFWRFVRWLRSDKPREGQDLYPDSAMYYSLMDDVMLAYKRLEKRAKEAGKLVRLLTRWEWLLGKLNR